MLQFTSLVILATWWPSLNPCIGFLSLSKLVKGFIPYLQNYLPLDKASQHPETNQGFRFPVSYAYIRRSRFHLPNSFLMLSFPRYKLEPAKPVL